MKAMKQENEQKTAYEKPRVIRMDLAVDETLSAGCKVDGTECTDPFPGLSEGGS
ncbi:MAG TPA: hypothetical protein VJ904_13420 [Tichowtungia sp.]|nr:hypothetical protein [Tichowtungia sp.]